MRGSEPEPRSGRPDESHAKFSDHAGDLRLRAEMARQRARTLIEHAKFLSGHEDNILEPSQESVPSHRQSLSTQPYARLVARLETMPTIEQAKGIIMAQSGCGADEAFDVLRRASQRSNVPVRELAAKMVESAAGRQGKLG